MKKMLPLIAGLLMNNVPGQIWRPYMRLTADQDTVSAGGVVTITCVATDPEGSALTFHWQSAASNFANPDTNPAFWTSPADAGDYSLVLTVTGRARMAALSATRTV